MARAAVFAALLAVTAQISIPLPSGVPLTLQTFAVTLTGAVLGSKLGGTAAAVYLALGAVGLPVFSGLRGGVAALAGPTGGFIYGFIIMAVLCGTRFTAPVRFSLAALGLILCHVCGFMHFALVTGNTPAAAFTLVSLPYLLKDGLSLAAGLWMGFRLRKLTLPKAAKRAKD